MTVLLDANVLIGLVVADHVHHAAAESWFASISTAFATSPITQGSLLRMLIRQGETSDSALGLLASTTTDSRHEFWPDSFSYQELSLTGVIGHRQVTDAYLAGLARHRGGRLATFDRGLAALHSDIAELVPTAK